MIRATNLRMLVTVVLALGIYSEVSAETLIKVPAGTYNLRDIVNRSGTSSDWVRFQSDPPGAAIIRGGGAIENSQYVILDGFVFDARLDPDFPTRASGLTIRYSTHVRVENTEFIGPNEVHQGYNVSNNLDCHEYAGGIPSGGFGAVDSTNVTFYNIVAHGFNNAASFAPGTTVTIEKSLIRNNFNGISFNANYLEVKDSVLWMHPNHLFSIKNPTGGTVRIVNNLIVVAQDMIKAGANWEGAEELHVQHNTFWIPANNPCYGFSGIHAGNVRQSVSIYDNIFVSKQETFLGTTTTQLPIYQSDYNLIHHHAPHSSGQEFTYNYPAQNELVLEEWRLQTGRDRSSMRGAPVFTDAPRFAEPLPAPGSTANLWGFRIPRSVAEARSWFTLRDGSAGKNAASDGRDMGIYPIVDSSAARPSAPSNLKIITGGN